MSHSLKNDASVDTQAHKIQLTDIDLESRRTKHV